MEKSKLSIKDLNNLVTACEIVMKRNEREANSIIVEESSESFSRYNDLVSRFQRVAEKRGKIIDEIEKRVLSDEEIF